MNKQRALDLLSRSKPELQARFGVTGAGPVRLHRSRYGEQRQRCRCAGGL
jgi:hypothetical protein